MSLEVSLRECCGGLSSQRANERKKSAEALKDFLSHNAVPTLLSQNTCKRQGYTWNDVFNDINDYVLKETEKFESAKNFGTTTSPLCSSLLSLCVSGSIKGKAYIKCDKITDASLYILKNNRLTKAIGDAYWNMLYKYVLSNEYYMGFITPSTWEELLTLCLSSCVSNNCTDDFTKMKLLSVIIRNAKNNCQFVIPLRDSLKELKICFQKFMDDKKMQEIIIDIMIVILETLTSECRLTVCEFTENILKSILSCYDPIFDKKKKPSYFKLLYHAVLLHHPCAVLRSEAGSFAHDWDTWTKQLRTILEIVYLESASIQKWYKQNDKNSVPVNYYSRLAASAYFQVINLSPENKCENEEPSTSKRQKISSNNIKTFRDLIEELKQNCFPWLYILHQYVQQYGHSLSQSDNIVLIVTLENLLTQSNTNMKTEILEEIICVVLENLLKAWDSSNEEYNKTIISLWNTCVRSSTVVNPGQMGVHKILQVLLHFNCLQFINAHTLIKLYYEKAMPVTDFSIKTLSRLFERFFSKCCSSENRLNFFNWLTQDQIMTANISGVQELILRLVANENFTLHQPKNEITRWETLHDVIFNAVDKSILFSEFELDMPKPAVNQESENGPFDLVTSTNEEVKKYLRLKLVDCIERHKSREFVIAEFMKFVNIALAYLDIMLQRNIMTCNDVKEDQLYCLTKTSLRLIYLSLTDNLKNKEIREQIKLLSNIKAIIISDFVPLLKSTVRATINQEFILCINHVLNEISAEGSESFYEEDDNEMNPNILRRQCITLLAAYCKEPEEYREEILKTLVLDPSIFNFSISWDIETCFQCIELLSQIADPPLDLIFDVMQSMCRELFRNPQMSCRILKTLSNLLEKLWVHDDSMKRNSYIMIKSYLQRCGQSFYPPYMAGLVYECAAKMVALNLAHSNVIDNDFLDIIIERIKGNTHSIRLYCCYLLQLIVVHLSSSEIESHSKSLLDIFVITVSESNDNVLRDESANRTLTLLHSFFALTEVKPSFVNTLLTQIIQIQHEKSLNEKLVNKILNRIATEATKQSIEEYLNNNILTFINSWFSNNKSIEQLPLSFFGFEHLDEFVKTHLNWLVAADALWCKSGDVRQSDVLKYVQHKFGKSVEEIIEASICNIIVLCLPYIVVEKYRLGYSIPGKQEWTKSAHTMFENTRQMLGANKWSGLFGDNLGQIVLLVATHLSDPTEAARMFQVDVPTINKSYQYSKEVYLSILRYFGELTDGNIMQHLCENWPLAIFNILFQLWRKVLQDNVLQYRVVSLHAFLTVLESIPWGNASDAFVCNFACNSLGHGVKESQTKDDVKILCKALQLFLESCFADKKKMLQKSVARILSILLIKKDAGFTEESAALLAYLTEVMRDADPAANLQESSDVVDFYCSLSQGVVQNSLSATKENFLRRLKMYKKSLLCLSLETLLDLKQFLKNNKVYVTTLSEDLNRTGGSDDCRTSILHQIVHRLCEILKTASNSKIILETSNCLAEIGNYDLNTLTTTAPPNTELVTNVEPKQYFTVSVINSLTDVLFDEKPVITNLAVKALKRILKYREGTNAVGEGLELVDTEILKPFASSESRMVLEFKINDAKFHSTCAINFWLPKDLELQTEWLTRVTLGLLDMLIGTDNSSLASCLTALRAVCSSKPSVCKKILPALVGVLLACSTEDQINKIGEHVNQFFKYIWDKNFDDTVASSYDSVAHNRLAYALDQDHKLIVRYMLDVVNFVRLQRSNYRPRPARLAENLNYLRLEYDKVSWAATVADQSVVAIYYGELWAAAGRGGVPPASPEDTSAMPGGENVQRIFRKCLVSIGEMDALDGCGTAHLTSEDERRKHLINTGLYTDALLLHDVALSCGSANPELQYGAIKSLHKAGLHHLALQYMSTVKESEELNDIKFDCLSYLGDWSVFVDTSALDDKAKQPNCNMNSVIKAYRYSCLKDCLNLQTSNGFEKKLIGPLSRAKLSIAKLCQSLNMENCQSVYRVLSNLHLLVDIEDYYAVRCKVQSIGDLLDRWRVEKMPKFHDFKYIEATINQRTSILEHAAKTFHRSIKDIVSLQLHYADLSLSNQRIQMAQRVLAVVKKQQNTQEVALLDSQISWAKGHKDIALSLLRNIINHPSPDTKLMAKSLRQYGLWMAESKCDNAREIIHKYLQKSLEVLENDKRDETTLKVYHEIANFADSEYKEVVSYMSSSVFENKVKCVETMKDTVCSLRGTQALNRDDRMVLNTNDKLGKIDEEEIASTRAEKESFLRLAMKYYLLSLKEGEANNLSIFRVISLWLANPTLQFSASEESFEELLHSIPSRKFIPVLPQLAPHLTTTHSVFVDNLTRIIKRCALEHPHHTLPILFSLKNSDKDEVILNSSQRSRRAPAEPRVAAAHALVEELARGLLADIIAQMNDMCDAMISFANYVPQTKEVRQRIPSAERIHRLGHLDTIPVPTDNIPISHDCMYTSIDSLFEIESHFEMVGGNNCPKKIKCKTLSGKTRIVLVKGKDDLRQDAVMQQVFNIVNTLLENNTITRKKKLTIRTYKVVPMSRRSGVLEWCEGTMPIGSFLTGSQGAHTRYRPQDTTPNAVREKLSIMHQRRNTNQEKLKVFLRLLENFKPVFHYFFTENYLDPVTWYERRLAYTKSVATSSMVGYIMGLGDRHMQNILIDKETAEVIHIDFGIAFDQGKALPTPETVPFRLTQDIVAGFGSCGVEGIFRRSCETTMQLLRDNQETLLTILEVLLCDPLYNWIITQKQQNAQAAPSNDTSVIQSSDGSLARRALLSVGSKLSGAEGGAGGVAAAGQVARLLAAAADPANLCRLYPGWQPHL